VTLVTLRRAFALLALAGTVSACDAPTQYCTLIGCRSGLQVRLTTAPAGAFSVEILPYSSGGQQLTYRIDCGGSAPPCGSQVFFPDLIIERAQIRVVTTRGTVTHSVDEVKYETSYPNGRQCAPACQSATVTVSTPE